MPPQPSIIGSKDAFLGYWGEEFDMDLLNLFPDLKDHPDILAAGAHPLWVYASTGEIAGTPVLSHPASWNGVGALYFSTEPTYPRDAHGWVNIHSLVTNTPLCCVSALTAVRDAWAHSLTIRLDFQPWTRPASYQEVFYPLMADLRKWHAPYPELDLDALRKQVKTWTIKACRRALKLSTPNSTHDSRSH